MTALTRKCAPFARPVSYAEADFTLVEQTSELQWCGKRASLGRRKGVIPNALDGSFDLSKTWRYCLHLARIGSGCKRPCRPFLSSIYHNRVNVGVFHGILRNVDEDEVLPGQIEKAVLDEERDQPPD